MFGRGDYGVQPVYVDDHAALMVEAGQRDDDSAIDSVGPEVFGYEEMVRLIARAVGANTRIAHVGKRLGMLMTGVVGLALRDVTLTRDEVDGLMANLLVSRGEATTPTRLTNWLAENGADLGRGLRFGTGAALPGLIRRHTMTQTDAQAALSAIDREDMLDLAKRMLRIPSFKTEETELAQFMAGYLEERGYVVELQEVEPGRFQTIATLKGEGGGKSLMFNGPPGHRPARLRLETRPLAAADRGR